MTTYEYGDTPLSDPAQDLLDMAPHAETLADFLEAVPLPFTIGIYGAWGEGKTTYANLLINYLSRKTAWKTMQVIKFSAWPYVTADAIWRALLDKIACKVLDQPTEPPDPQPTSPDSAASLRERIRHFLLADALTLRAEPVDERRQQYERLRKRFDRSAVLANRTTSEGDLSPNTSALVGLVLDAATTVSPTIGPLRRFLGVGEGSVRDVMAGGQPSAPEAVASVEELREDLQWLFRESASKFRLVILLDDLDRCLPHVALDFLETVKVFFFESEGVAAPYLFLVAVDEDLIGRGLQMRIGSVPSEDAGEEARMYLEKIVQLRIPVPSPDDGRVHQLVSASFPEWAWTTDIFAVGLGRNPRRIKQQCNLMTYRFLARTASSNASH